MSQITTAEIIAAINTIEEVNNQSVSFVMHGDGSGCFEDFWDETPCYIEDTLLTFPNDERGGFPGLKETLNFIKLQAK